MQIQSLAMKQDLQYQMSSMVWLDRSRQTDFICSTVVEKDVKMRRVRMDQPDEPGKRKMKKAPKMFTI